MTSVLSLNQVLRPFRKNIHNPQSDDYETIQTIREYADGYRAIPDRKLSEHVDQLRNDDTDALNGDLATIFALVNEAARRTLGIDYYDVQLLAGMALARGAIAEMQTGEGKTFVAALPTLLFALAGRGVHVMTVNAYLAERDCEQLKPLYHLLGMSTGFLKPQAPPDDKRHAYDCDITYGPGYEFGFDYLRDQAALMKRQSERAGDTFRRILHGDETNELKPIQRGHAFAIIDEVDSVLIDEASSPLILSASSGQPAAKTEVYLSAKKTAAQLVAGHDYCVEPTNQMVRLTTRGAQQATSLLSNLPSQGLLRPWTAYVEQALRAKELLTKDVDYIVDQDAIVLVDESTGRIFHDRSLRDGLHQAIEVKEGVTVTAEQQPLARIPRQRYVRLYDLSCGMTGTAAESEHELWEFYRLAVVRIPLRKESRRNALPPRFFGSQEAKWKAVVKDIVRVQHTRQPLLVGTRTIENSVRVAQQLDGRGVPYRLLNGVQDADEAVIVAQAGAAGAVTIATNMAGRGTDIKLDDHAAKLGGLHVIATEPHQSPRVDRQLVGRCARQGDPGSCQLFVSADDPLVIEYAPGMAARMRKMAKDNGEIEEDLSAEIARVQRKAERANYRRRCRLFAHDTWMDKVLSTLAKED